MLIRRAEGLSACCSRCAVCDPVLPCRSVHSIKPACRYAAFEPACFCALKARGETSARLCRDVETAPESPWEEGGSAGCQAAPQEGSGGSRGAAGRDSRPARHGSVCQQHRGLGTLGTGHKPSAV